MANRKVIIMAQLRISFTLSSGVLPPFAMSYAPFDTVSSLSKGLQEEKRQIGALSADFERF